MPPKGNVAARAAKIAEDKTFGMKNKNKSKKVRPAGGRAARAAANAARARRHVRALPCASSPPQVQQMVESTKRRWRTSWSARR